MIVSALSADIHEVNFLIEDGGCVKRSERGLRVAENELGIRLVTQRHLLVHYAEAGLSAVYCSFGSLRSVVKEYVCAVVACAVPDELGAGHELDELVHISYTGFGVL